MKKTAEAPSIKEQNRLVDAWKAERPEAPTSKRPRVPHYTRPLFGLGIPLFIAGVIVAAVITGSMWQAVPVLALLIVLVTPFAFALGIPIGISSVVDVIKYAIYSRAMVLSGWATHEEDLRTWRLIGDEDFGHWRESNEHVMYALAWAQPDPLRHLPPLTSADINRAIGMKVDKPKPKAVSSIPDEFDLLESYLDSLPSVPKHNLALPNRWRLRWAARQQARLKTEAVAKGARYIEEIRFPTYRILGVVGGWISTNTSVGPAERVAIAKQIRPHFERYGLKVTNVLAAWTGMSNAGEGSDSFDLIIRLA